MTNAIKNLKKQSLGKVPLERAFSKLGIFSRAQAKALIKQGRVTVNGKICLKTDFLVIPEITRLEIDGRLVKRETWKTILFYKPRGIVTTRSDEKGRPTIYSLLPNELHSLHPVGRLDLATSGLLILTNDSRLSNFLTDPKNKIQRTYLVTVKGNFLPENVKVLLKGIEDKGEKLFALSAILNKASQRESHLTLTLTEGKNREVRRMFEALGHEVTRIKRTTFGALTLEHLSPGKFKHLQKEDCQKMFPNAFISFS